MAIISAVQENTAPMFNILSLVITNVSSGPAIVVASSLAASSGTIRLPAYISTSQFTSAITGSNSSHLTATFISPVMATHATSAFSGLDSSICSPSFDKAIAVGPRHALIPAKLVSKIPSSQFMDVADLLSANLTTTNFSGG